jgi:hypothetical protein
MTRRQRQSISGFGRIVAVPVAVLLLAGASSRPIDAWGFTAHRFIMDRAIALLPQEIRPFFEAYRTTVVEHAIDPDTYRTMGFAEEPPRHFLDMDAYGPFPFTALPHDRQAAIDKFGAEFVAKNGLLPWRTQEIADRLREAFKQTTPYARDDIKLFSAVVTHYISDAFQPFHAAVNYDGQLTGQHGVHARFETELFERYQDKVHVTPKPVATIDNVRDFTFATLTDSFRHVDEILAADRAAAAGRSAYDDEYFTKFFARTQPIVEQRIAGAITAAASIITSEWVRAGKPDLPAVAPPRPIRQVR